MKKIGIITTFRQTNWGSVLQAFALQKKLEKLGYDSEIIDYYYPNQYHWNRGLLWGRPKRGIMISLRNLKKKILCFLKIRPWPLMYVLNQFIKENMLVSQPIKSYEELHNNPPIYDIYISGSDQIWNPNTMYGDMSYFFDFVADGSKIISYSSSFSCDSIPDKYKEQYKKYLNRFSSISVRESNGCKLVKELIGRDDVQLVLDPTLLMDKNEWMQYAMKARNMQLPRKYILCYMLAYTYNPEEKMVDILKFVQKKYNLPIVSLNPIKSWDGGEFILIHNNNEIVGISEFLRLFVDAEMVITSSFHGTAFSLNFEKPFLALQNGKSNSDDRISSLLEMIGMQSQLITTSTYLGEDITPFYDVNIERQILQKKRELSMKFLESNLLLKGEE